MKKKWMKITSLICTVALLSTTAFAFEPSTAISYAEKFAVTENSAYHYYDGADCTNFVSQCLYSGKLTKETGVWDTYVGSDGKYWGRTNWVNANSFKDYLKTRGATKIGNWQKTATLSGFYSYTNNSANLTDSNKGRTVIFYDWDGDWTIDHSALFVVNNGETWHNTLDGDVTGDLTDQHSTNYKHLIWNADKRNRQRSTTLIYAFQLPL